MKYFSEILGQFSKQQKIFVLLILSFFTSGTYIVTSYLNSSQKDCHELIELNKKYVSDFVKISDMIRKERMSKMGLDSAMMVVNETSGPAPTSSYDTIIKSNETIILDSILKITENTSEITK